MSHHEQNFFGRLRDLGYRVTPQRQIILDVLCEIEGHATINQIYKQVNSRSPAIDKATVYRSLQLFSENDFITEAKINGQTVYEIVDVEPHHHLVCRQCNTVIALADHHFHELTRHLLHEHGFAANINHLTIPGICAACLSNQHSHNVSDESNP